MSRSRFRPMGAAQIAATNALMALNEGPRPTKAQRRPIITADAVARAQRASQPGPYWVNPAELPMVYLCRAGHEHRSRKAAYGCDIVRGVV